MYAFKWPPIHHTFDSVASGLERQFLNFAPPDSILHSIAILDSLTLSADTTLHDILNSRTLYWKSRYAYKYGNRLPAIRYIKEALAHTDSAERRYDWYRFQSQLHSSNYDITAAEMYIHYDDALKYARSIGDKGYEAMSAVSLGNVMRIIGEYDKALKYYQLSNSLLLTIGFEKPVVKNQINIASTYNEMGQTGAGDSILKSLQGNPALMGDTFAMNLIPRNLYDHSREDTAYLRQAYRQIADNPRFRNLRGLYRGLFAGYFVDERNPDSARYYLNLAMEDLPYVEEYGHSAIIWYNRSMVCMMDGKPDSAYLARIQFETYIDSLRQHEHQYELNRLNGLEEMRKRETLYAASIARRNWIMAFVVAVIVAVGAVVVLMLNRRHIRQRMRSMENELELEKAKRKMAATAITIEEKDAMLGSLRNELSEMRREGEIQEGSANRLESSIQAHMSEHENEETFRTMFDTVNPGFTARLREISPDLTDNLVKLASYILMELDNKRIASLMGIKLESVHQTRWRLRRRLNIPEDTTLEEFLRQLNKMKS